MYAREVLMHEVSGDNPVRFFDFLLNALVICMKRRIDIPE